MSSPRPAAPASGGLSTATVGPVRAGVDVQGRHLARAAAGRADARVDGVLPATITVDGRRFKNYDDYPSDRLGQITLRTAVANSCNTAMIGQRGKVPQADLAAAAAALGLGVDHDLGYPAFLGSVPTDAGSETEHAASMIGQGRVQASPVAMAAVAASVARGATVTPQLLQDAAGGPRAAGRRGHRGSRPTPCTR